MRFSTRNTHKRGKAIALAAGAAILGVGGTVGYLSQKDASAETSANTNGIFYALTTDYASTDAAAGRAQTVLGSSEVTRCTTIGNDGVVSRTNPKTGQSANYWVYVKGSDTCPTTDDTTDQVLNDNGATFLNQSKIQNAGDNFYGAATENFYDHYGNQFGILGSFHIMSFYETQTGVQAYGNVATRLLNSTANNNIDHFEVNTLSYIENIAPNVTLHSFSAANGSESSVLIVGKDANIAPSSDGGWLINDNRANSPSERIDSNSAYKDNIWQEYEGGPQFLNFNELKATAIDYNKTISQYDDTLTSGTDYDLQVLNNKWVKIKDDNGINVINTTYQTLQGTSDVYVSGFDQAKDSTLIVNIDMNGAPNPLSTGLNWKICYDDSSKITIPGSTDLNNGHTCIKQQWYKDKFPNQIILNFFDSSASEYTYNANTDQNDDYTINFTKGSTAATIAPRGKVLVTVTPYQGMIIANNVSIPSGDTYFLSFSDNLPILPEPETCELHVYHFKTGTTIPVDDEISMTHYCNNIQMQVEISQTALNNGYTFNSAKAENGGITELDEDDFPYTTTNNYPVKVFTLYYDDPVPPEPETCALYIHHYKKGTTEKVDDDISMENICGNIQMQVEISAKALSDGYTFNSAKMESERIVINSIPESEFPLTTTNNFPVKVYTIYYDTPEPQPETCAIYVHHYKKGTTEKVDEDISMTHYCGNIQMQVEISENALAKGYKFDSAKLESERIVWDYTEEDFPLTTTNNFPVKIYTLYYTETETPDTPNTKDNNPAFMLTAAGTVFGLSTAAIFLARRRS